MKKCTKVFASILIFTLIFQNVCIFDFGQVYAEESVSLNNIAISGGYKHSAALKEDGTVWTWGDNEYGQLGIGGSADKTTPVQVTSLTDITTIDAGDEHTLALKSNGTVWAWGRNSEIVYAEPYSFGIGFGRLGDGTTTDRSTPVQVLGLNNVVESYAGFVHSMALKSDGTVWTWGDNIYGQLGIGESGIDAYALRPVKAYNITNVMKIAAGFFHSMALKSDGTVWTWGVNQHGELGDGTTTDRTTPVQVSGLNNVISIGAGGNHNMALKSDGTVWTWGDNEYGQLGNGTTTRRLTPVQVSGLNNVVAIASGGKYSMALKSDGTVWTWGDNEYGQLGNGTTTNRTTPVQVSGLSNVVEIAAGGHCMALKDNDTLWAWGYNSDGQLGDGTTTNRTTPVQVSGLNLNTVIPTISINAPTTNQVVSEMDTAFQPQITVSEAKNNTLTCKYYVDSETSPRDTKTVTNAATAKTVTFNTLNMSTLSEGTHTLRFEVSDGFTPVVQSVNFKVDKSAPTLGTVSLSSSTTGITVSGSATDSVAGLHTYPYRYTVGSSITSWLSSNAYTKSGLSLNKQYTVKFEAKDKIGHINSKTQSIYTKAQIPSLNIDNKTSYTLDVNISDNNPTSTQYQLKTGSYYVTEDGILTTSPVWITIPTKELTVTGLSPSTTYSFQARAKNESGIVTSWSTAVSGTTIVEPPTTAPNVSTSSNSSSISLSWNPVARATAYDIKKDGVQENDVTSPYLHSGLSPNTQHTYEVRARNAGGSSNWTSVSKYTQANKPSGGNITDITNTSLNATWTSGSNPSGTAYKLGAFTTDDTFVKENTWTTNLSGSITEITPETSYRIKVKAKNSESVETDWHEIGTITTLPDPPNAPTGLTAIGYDDRIIIKWPAVERATGYIIEINGEEQGIGNNTTYTHTNIAANTSYTYKVRAINTGGSSSWSDPLIKSTLPSAPDVPIITGTTPTNTSVTITWGEIAGAIGYEIEADGVIYNSGIDTSYLHSGLEPGTDHTYRVRSRNEGGKSSWSSTITATTALESPNIPANLSAEPTENSIIITWNEIDGALGYICEIDGVETTVTEAVYEHTGLQPETQHTYRVRTEGDGGLSDWSTKIIVSTLAEETIALKSPANIEITPTSNSIAITWDEAETALSYDIELNSTLIDNVTVTDYVYSNLEPETTQIVRIRSKNEEGISSWSAPISVTTLADVIDTIEVPIGLSATATITVTWQPVDGAIGYDIEADGVIVDRENETTLVFIEPSTDPTFEVTVNNGNETTFHHTGLVPNTPHTYRIRTITEEGKSAWSAPLTLTAPTSQIPVVPTNLKAEPTETTLLITWDNVTGATGYDIEADGVIISGGNNNAYIQNGLLPNTAHTYRVRAKNPAGISSWSSPLTKSTLEEVQMLLTTPTNIETQATDVSLTITWDNVIGAQNYDIEIDGIQKANISSTTYILEGLEPNSQYIIRLRANSTEGMSSWSEPIIASTQSSVSTAIETPKNISGIPTDTSISILWDEIENATDYDIEINSETIDNISVTNYVYGNLTPETSYSIRIRANNEQMTSNWSSPITVTTLADADETPTNVTAEATENTVTVNWNPVENAIGYDIEIDGIVTDNGTATTYTHTELALNSQHSYRVRAQFNDRVGQWSRLVTVKIQTTTYTIETTNNEEFDLILTASNIEDFSEATFTVTYNPGEIEVVDLCSKTEAKDLTTGEIEETNITITEYIPGKIRFTIDKALIPGRTWSGIVNEIRYKGRTNGQINITYAVQ